MSSAEKPKIQSFFIILYVSEPLETTNPRNVTETPLNSQETTIPPMIE